MELWENIIAEYSELTERSFIDGTIILQDDSDGKGAYISEWNYAQPIPDGLKVGK
jgi:hypothetical protein